MTDQSKTEQGPPAITLRGVTKAHGDTAVLTQVDLEVPAGEVTAVLGASGSGKTTLLRLIAGFDTADAGRISIDGTIVDDGRRTIGAQHRGVGYVPQDAALFPHLSVAANVGFGVERRLRRACVAEMLELVGLTGYQRRRPHQLSGGQQQRIALARALAIRPKVVLLDEPFGALDAALRETVRNEVIKILNDTGTTTVLVTHDQDEALSLANHVALLDHGHIAAHGTPEELYQQPPTPEVATAIGIANTLPGRILRQIDGDLAHSPLGTIHVTGAGGLPQGECQLVMRPEDLRLDPEPCPGAVAATVTAIHYHGHDTLITVSLAGPDGPAPTGMPATVVARMVGASTLQIGQSTWVTTTAPARAWPA